MYRSKIFFCLFAISLSPSCNSSNVKSTTAKIRESHFADENKMLIFSLGSAAGDSATSSKQEQRARAAKNAKEGALSRALEICRNADPRVYLVECKPGAPKIAISAETQSMQNTLSAAMKLVAESCDGASGSLRCEADYEIRLPNLRQKCIEFARRKACGEQ